MRDILFQFNGFNLVTDEVNLHLKGDWTRLGDSQSFLVEWEGKGTTASLQQVGHQYILRTDSGALFQTVILTKIEYLEILAWAEMTVKK